jgi:hypothetical protein
MSFSSDQLRRLHQSVHAALNEPARTRQQALDLIEERLRAEQRRSSPDLDLIGTLFGLCTKLRTSLSRASIN